MENALQNSLTAADPGFAEVVPSNAQFSKYSRYTDDEGYIIHPDTGEYMSMDEMRQEVKELNRMHLHHLHTAKQHVHTDPICLPTLEAAVARASADNLLTEDEEMLRTLASPVLFWRHAVYDPKDLDTRDFASEEELTEWRSKTIPDSQFEILDKRSVYELRKFDGDVGDVMRRWGCDNDAFARFDSEIAEGRTHSRQHTVGKTRSALDERLQKWRSERRGVGRVDDAKSTSDISIKTNDANGAASSLAPNRAPKPRPGGAGSKRRNFSKSPRAPSAFARVATAHSRVF
jgi:5'-3' exoribonuclease 1